MNRLFASFLSLSLLLASCTSSQPKLDTPTLPPPSTVTAIPDPMQIDWDDRSIFKSGLVESQQHILNELNSASVYHIEFTIAENMYEITGTEEVRYTNTEEVELNEIQFRLFPNILGGEMNISNLTIDGQSHTLEFELENSLMIVRLSSPLEIGQSLVLKMDFAVTIPQSLDLNYGVLAYVDSVLALAHAYPVIAVYDDEGWNAEIPPQDGDVAYQDVAFYIVRIHAPKTLTLATSGTRISLDEDGQTQVLIIANGPARDFYLAASPNYEETSQTFGELTIRSYAPKELKDGAKITINVAARAIEIFSQRYAPYPYTELDIISTPTLALGIEYPGAIAITSRIYDESSNHNGYIEATVAHEVGHQWFYSLVGDDQLDDPWLDESLTQFATLQYFTDKYGENGASGFLASLEGRWARIGNADIPIGLPVADYKGAEYSAIVYGRGPLFFLALRDEMGTDTFDAFIKEYTETLSWGIATPEYMLSLAESHCICQLDELFENWVY